MSNSKFAKLILIIFFSALLVLVYRFSSAAFDALINDALIKFSAAASKKHASDRIVLITADDKSAGSFFNHSARDKFAELFDYLENKAGADVILFSSPAVFPGSKDSRLYNTVQNSKKLINTYILSNSNILNDAELIDYLYSFNITPDITIKDNRTKKFDFSYKKMLPLPDKYAKAAKHTAYSLLSTGLNGRMESYIPAAMYNGALLPSAALSAYAMHTGIIEFVLTDKYLCAPDDCSILKIPVYFKKITDEEENGTAAFTAYFDWKMPENKHYSFKNYSMSDVLANKAPLEEFKDKIVIAGVNAPDSGLSDMYNTPVLKQHAGMDIHALMIESMLDNSFKTIPSKNYAAMIAAVFCFFIMRGFKKFKQNIIFTSVLALLYLVYFLYQYFLGIYSSFAAPVITMYAAAVLKSVYYTFTADTASDKIKSAMDRYMSKDIAARIMSNIDKLETGGVRTEAAILFADIRNFTGISEELPPNKVTEILNEYFSAIEPVIAKHKGIVNKYLGDGLLAVFEGAPGIKQQTRNAVLCGIEMIERVKILREKFKTENKPAVNIGIGINTGEVFAGNIGTKDRLEYTVIGDSVNLASRIEDYNQILKTQFLISEYTYEYVKDMIDAVKLSGISIKGKSKPVDIYEVLRIKE